MTLTIDTSTRTIHRGNFDHNYTADCFINPESYDPSSRMNRAWCITNGGYIIAIVFAEYYSYCDQDALDEAADSGKLDFLQISESDLADYETGKDSEGYPEYEGIINLGNASEPFDQENLDYFTVPASLFALDPVIMAVIEEQSRNEACELMRDRQKDSEYPNGYYLLQDAISRVNDQEPTRIHLWGNCQTFTMTLEDARSVSHQGQCDEDVTALAKAPYIAEQLAQIEPTALADYLKEFGAWDANELADHDANMLRFLWSAGCDIQEQENERREVR